MKNVILKYRKNEYHYHVRTNLHKSNCILKTKYENIDIIATTFRMRIISYKLNPSMEYLTPEEFLMDNQHQVRKLINDCLIKHNCVKLNFELYAYFILPKSGEQQLKSFNTKFNIIWGWWDLPPSGLPRATESLTFVSGYG